MKKERERERERENQKEKKKSKKKKSTSQRKSLINDWFIPFEKEEKVWSKQMPSQDKWDCIKQLSAVAQVNVKKRERKVEKSQTNQLNWTKKHLFKPSG